MIPILRPLLLLLVAVPVLGEAAVPPCNDGTLPRQLASLSFEGNRVTQRQTFLRELNFSVGDVVCPSDIAAGEQAITDLGLFSDVDTATTTLEQSRVAVTYTVKERWYILPIPRVDASTDEEFGLGMSLSWNNFLGLNHKISMSGVRKELEERTTDNETVFDASYSWRRFMGSRTNLGFSLEYRDEGASVDELEFEERVTSFGVFASRQLTRRQTGQGWNLSGGLGWRESRNLGAEAPPDEGVLTALTGGLGYRDVHDKIYSFKGTSYGVSVTSSVPGISDYAQYVVSGGVTRYIPIGTRAHQNINLYARAGSFHGGPRARRNDNFELGGADRLRGYEDEYTEGDAFWAVGAEYLRPLYWNALRGLVILEAGDALSTSFAEQNQPVMVSIGLGLRIRITWFVDAAVEVGVAWPLIRGDGAQIFAGGAD
ncbi:MAG: BamA/TamA family outer membrane protein [Algiphilus sp.]